MGRCNVVHVSTARIVEGTMYPPGETLTDTLPHGRIRADGRPTGELRGELYRIPDLANAVHVVGVWAQSVGVIALARWWGHPVGWVIAFAMCGRGMVRFAILMHEAAHRLLFSNRAVNDWVGKWLLAYPTFTPIDAYRRSHMAHHREEFGPREPDIAFYRGYPLPPESWWRKMRRDAFGVSGWKNLKALFLALRSDSARPIAARILGTQVVMFVLLWAIGGHWWTYPLLWLLPWMTVWRVLNRLRAVAEHGGLGASPDRRVTTHHVRQSFVAKAVFVPFNTGYHLAHHVDSGVPFARLPAFQRELEEAGYITAGLEWPNYRSLWRHARSGAADRNSDAPTTQAGASSAS